MRILTVGNMYPPHHLGGYELMWRSAVRHLRTRGHEVRVLTSDYRSAGLDPAVEEDTDVHRQLRWYWHDHEFPRLTLRQRMALERHNARILRKHLNELAPDAVSWWAMGGMSLSLVEQVRRAGVPAAGVVVDDWLIYGPEVDAWLRVARRLRPLDALAERATGVPTRVDLAGAGAWLFVSDTVRRRAAATGARVPDAAVAHAGIETALFDAAPPKPWRGRLLYLGRIDRRKGIETALRALTRLPDSTTLEVVGGGDDDHLRELQKLSKELGLDVRVSFSRRARDELSAAYADADVLVFPVLWEEPFGLVPLEAMAVGTPVVATGTGGSGEYLEHERNCLIFQPRDDPAALAAAVARLGADEGLRNRLREGGLKTAALFDEGFFNDAVLAQLERVVDR